MAHYLITKPGPDYDLVLTDVEAKSLTEAIETLDLEDGEAISVYRMSAPPRIVRVHDETVRRIDVT